MIRKDGENSDKFTKDMKTLFSFNPKFYFTDDGYGISYTSVTDTKVAAFETQNGEYYSVLQPFLCIYVRTKNRDKDEVVSDFLRVAY